MPLFYRFNQNSLDIKARITLFRGIVASKLNYGLLVFENAPQKMI